MTDPIYSNDTMTKRWIDRQYDVESSYCGIPKCFPCGGQIITEISKDDGLHITTYWVNIIKNEVTTLKREVEEHASRIHKLTSLGYKMEQMVLELKFFFEEIAKLKELVATHRPC
ncbi:hypothetical protein Bca4012_064105 [Brassica carinata]